MRSGSSRTPQRLVGLSWLSPFDDWGNVAWREYAEHRVTTPRTQLVTSSRVTLQRHLHLRLQSYDLEDVLVLRTRRLES